MTKIRLQAHRGVCSECPENTFAAFRTAVDEGYDIIELDPKFCDVIVKRYIEQVGSSEKVSCQRDGLTYSYDELDPSVIPQF